MIPFADFKANVREAEKDGTLKFSDPLSDYDLAVMWALGRISEEKGTPCETTIEEIYDALPDEFKNYTEE